MSEPQPQSNPSEYESNINYGSDVTGIGKKPKAKETIQILERRKKIYMWMIYLVAFVSGSRLISMNVNFWYLKTILKLGVNDFTFFTSYSPLMYDFKPIFSFVSEVFFPLYMRVKFYMIFSSLLIVVGSALVCVFELGYWPFFFVTFIQCTGYAIVDSLGEGLTAEVVKFDKKITLLRSSLDPTIDTEINSKKAFGNFYNFRNFVFNTSIFFGSYFVDEFKSMTPFFAVQGIIAALMIAFTIFVFDEPRKERMISGFLEMGADFILVFRYVFEPSIFIPQMFFWLMNCIPGLSSTT